MKQFLASLVWLVVLVVFGVGLSVAYFTFAGKTGDSAFMTGKMELELTGVPVENTGEWMPGGDKTIEYTLSNFSTTPLQAKAYTEGSWDQDSLAADAVSLKKIERFDGTTWIPITAEAVAVGDEFELMAQPNDTEAMVLEPDAELKLRVAYHLAAQLTDDYQDALFTSSLHVAGKQAVADASWPASY